MGVIKGANTSEYGRTGAFRNDSLEGLLRTLNEDLSVAESRALCQYVSRAIRVPPVFVLGAPRCGSTLFMQWLASTGAFTYPTNLLSRFWEAPIIGARVQRMLSDPAYDFRGELYDLKRDPDFRSDLGKTAGALSPNEFWYFWRRFFFGDEYLSRDYLERNSDAATLRAEIGGVTDVLGGPFAAKGMIFNENVPYMGQVFPEAIFVWVRRRPEYNVQSLLRARERHFGDMGKWYSFRIRDYPQLKDRPPVESVSGQIASIHKSLEDGLADIPDERTLVVDYESFCSTPRSVYDAIQNRLRAQEFDLPDYSGPAYFDPQREWRLDWVSQEEVLEVFRASEEEVLRARSD